MRSSRSNAGPGGNGAAGSGIPDMRWINANLPIRDVAHKLDLRVGEGGKIHCYRPERHKHGDRTPSIGVRTSNNTVRCFGCGEKPLSVLDLVMDVRKESLIDAVQWLDSNFEIPRIAKHKHLDSGSLMAPYLVGCGSPTELLVRSGIWARLSPASQRLVPVLLAFAERGERNLLNVKISYRGMMRYAGVGSHNSVSAALKELSDIAWLVKQPAKAAKGEVIRDTQTYTLTPFNDSLVEVANELFLHQREIIQAEREMRRQQRSERAAVLRQRPHADGEATQRTEETEARKAARSPITKYDSLYPDDSVKQDGATDGIA